MSSSFQAPWRHALNAGIVLMLATAFSACAQTAVRPAMRVTADRLSPPPRIYVYDVLTDGARVTEYTGILRQQPSNPDPAERRREIRESAIAAFQSVLMLDLKKLGFAAQLVSRSTPVAPDELVLDSRLQAVHPGDPLRRLILGLGSGASSFEITISAFQGPERRKLLEFTILADSGRMPGAAVMLPAGAAVHGGITTSLVASSAASSSFSAYQTNVTQMAASSANQAARYLSEFFAEQGWISPHRVKKARIAYNPTPARENAPRR